MTKKEELLYKWLVRAMQSCSDLGEAEIKAYIDNKLDVALDEN